MKAYQILQFGRLLFAFSLVMIGSRVVCAVDVTLPPVTNNLERVAVFASDPMYYIRDVQDKIRQNGNFETVDGFSILPGYPVPTLAQLQRYHAIFIFSDIVFNDPVALGNVLADYVDGGGRLVMSGFSFSVPVANGYGIEGRLARGGYFPFTYGWTVEAPNLTLVPDLPDHPILAGVRYFNGGVRSIHTGVYMETNATKVAHWSDGMPMVATKECGKGSVVGLCIFPVSTTMNPYFWQAETDGGRLMANALKWVPERISPAIVTQPANLTVPQGSNAVFTVIANGQLPLSYQWFKDGRAISGATNSSCHVSRVQPTDAGLYSVRITNNHGSITSDTSGNFGRLTVVPVKPSTSKLTVWIEGNGTVAPFLSGQTLEIGKSYTFKAKPGNGCVFVNWQSGIGGGSETNLSFLSADQQLVIVMQTNLVLKAIFEPDYVSLAKGSYNGLFSDPINGVTMESAGLIEVKLTKKGAFTGSLCLQNKKHVFQGAFDSAGHALVSLAEAPISLELNMDWRAKSIKGTVSSTAWSATVIANATAAPGIAVQNNWIGKYTMILPGTDDPAVEPTGHGFGLFNINPNGIIHLTANIPGGAKANTKGSQTVALTVDGRWALYLPLYSGEGLLFGSLTVTNDGGRNAFGTLTWLKGGSAGFTNNIQVEVSPYDVPIAGDSIMSATNFTVILAGGDLLSPLTNNIAVGIGDRMVVSGSNPNKLAFAVNRGNGSVTGSFQSGKKKQSIFGAVLRNQTNGFGYFQAGANSGSFSLLPN